MAVMYKVSFCKNFGCACDAFYWEKVIINIAFELKLERETDKRMTMKEHDGLKTCKVPVKILELSSKNVGNWLKIHENGMINGQKPLRIDIFQQQPKNG